MKALVLKEYMQLALQDVAPPRPGPGEVLLAVRACGICGSDVHGIDGSTGRRRPPIIMGHEAAGEIAALGPGVTVWRPGERVTFDSTVYCGECWFCRRGRINLCDNRRVLGVSCEDYRRDGAFAEFIAVPQHILYRLPQGISFEQAAMVEALSIAVHAVGRAPLRLGDTAVVVGAGMIGLLIIQVLRAAGAARVIAVDLDQDKLDLAAQQGADIGVNINRSMDPAEVAREQTGGRGADVVFEAVGIPPTFHMAVAAARKGGTVVLVGNLTPKVELGLQAAVTRELNLLGSCASAGEYPACLDLIARGAVNVDALISAVAPLEDGPAWFDRLYKKEPGLMKVILRPV